MTEVLSKWSEKEKQNVWKCSQYPVQIGCWRKEGEGLKEKGSSRKEVEYLACAVINDRMQKEP